MGEDLDYIYLFAQFSSRIRNCNKSVTPIVFHIEKARWANGETLLNCKKRWRKGRRKKREKREEGEEDGEVAITFGSKSKSLDVGNGEETRANERYVLRVEVVCVTTGNYNVMNLRRVLNVV